ncbi:hypothetical protein J4438_03860 [Candidatus Woesearchaeota archaeon]|nr:hypothetical protein [Candidatus Woesearchaeota archaeon]
MPNYRATKLYKKLTMYVACAYAEGFNEGENATPTEQLIAWQWISDRGLQNQLQGFYGRMVNELIKHNKIRKPK